MENTKFTQYEKDLDALILKGHKLCHLFGSITKDSIDSAVSADIDKFTTEYQQWYSETLNVVKIFLPDRYNDFKKLYDKPANRKCINVKNYTIEDAVTEIYDEPEYSMDFDWNMPNFKAAYSKLILQVDILASVKSRFVSKLWEMQTCLQADLFDDDISAAESLNKHGYTRAAGAMAGVVIERHLKAVCNNHALTISKTNPTINDFNDALKNNGVLDIVAFRKIQYMADIRNKCDHAKKAEPTKEEINDLLSCSRWLIKNIF